MSKVAICDFFRNFCALYCFGGDIDSSQVDLARRVAVPGCVYKFFMIYACTNICVLSNLKGQSVKGPSHRGT